MFIDAKVLLSFHHRFIFTLYTCIPSPSLFLFSAISTAHPHVLMMSQPSNMSKHDESRHSLTKTWGKVARLESPYLEASQLQDFGIYISECDLTDAEHSPQYFLPASKEKLASLEHLRPQEMLLPPKPGDFNYYKNPPSKTNRFFEARDIADVFRVHMSGWLRDLPSMAESTQWLHRTYVLSYHIQCQTHSDL